MRLGVDPRKADQMVRGVVNLPHGTGKTARVIVFAAGAKADEAEAAGADEVGTDELVARIQGGWLDFDAAIATPDQMAKIGRIARILGPRGLMPNPKTGTVTMDVAKAVTGHQGRQDHLPGRQALQPAPDHRQGELHRGAADRQLRRRARRGAAGQAVRRQGQVPAGRSSSPRRWARASRSTRTAPATCTRTTRPPPERTLPRSWTRGAERRGGSEIVGRRRRFGRSRPRRVLLPRSSTRRPLVTVSQAWSKVPPQAGGPRRMDGQRHRPAVPTQPSARSAPCALRRGVSRCSAAASTTSPRQRERRDMADKPVRADKATAVAELTDRFRDSSATLLTEYRGLTVAQLKELRRVARPRDHVRGREEHAGQARGDGRGHRRSRRSVHRSYRARLRLRRPGRGGQGSARFREGPPAAGHQGRRLRGQGRSPRTRSASSPTSSPARCCWPSWPAR